MILDCDEEGKMGNVYEDRYVLVFKFFSLFNKNFYFMYFDIFGFFRG